MMRIASYVLATALILVSVYVAQVPGVPGIPAAPTTSADTAELTGYAWSANIGWISMNCSNTGTCGTSDYAVVLDTETNELTGYAWSANIGWIQFGGLTGCPGGGDCDARMEGNELKGWARANSGDGMVPDTMSTSTTTNYATTTFPALTAGTTYTVPAQATSLMIKAWGAGGAGGAVGVTAGGHGGAGGAGGYVQTTINVTPGESLTVRVGGGGGTYTNAENRPGGGGGGYSGVFRSTTPLAIAGGGGGGGAGGDDTGVYGGAGGVGGGSTGGSGSAGLVGGGGGGGGGTQIDGGVGGVGRAAATGQTGSSLQGGYSDGGTGSVGGLNGGATTGDNMMAGGGGGGYFGGGGGGAVGSSDDMGGGGGGGGSNYVSGTVISNSQGSGTVPPNTEDSAYSAGVGVGGAYGVYNTVQASSGGVGRVVVVSSYTTTSTSSVPAPLNGWDGWMSLNCADTSSCGTADYGVTVGTTELDGYAWGSDVVGWISMNCTSGGASGENVCATSNYRVQIDAPCGSPTYACSADNSASELTDAWCVMTSTTCSAGETCRADLGSICGPGSPVGQLVFSSQKVRKGSTVDISWPTLAYYDECRVEGTPTGGVTDSWNWSSSTPLVDVTTTAIQSEVTYTLECTPIGGGAFEPLDTERVSLLPSIREF